VSPNSNYGSISQKLSVKISKKNLGKMAKKNPKKKPTKSFEHNFSQGFMKISRFAKTTYFAINFYEDDTLFQNS
jgi:hypothetical protein